MANETRALAHFAADLDYTQIPDHVRARAIDLIVDQIGCEIGGSALPWSRQVCATYSRAGGAPEATVVKHGQRLPLCSAVFINSTFGHAFEYDDRNPLFYGHPGPELVPSMIATAEREHTPGREFLAAFVAAYEVRGRVSWAVAEDLLEHGGPQFSTACGPYSVAAGVARLLGLDADGIRNALAIAGTFSGGLMQYDHGGGSVKRIFPAVAASGGIQSACLAQAGMTGPEGILEGARGFLKIYGKTYRPERLVADFGGKWTLETACFKPYACVGIAHTAIDGFSRLVADHDLRADMIAAVHVGYPIGFHAHAAIAAPTDILGMQFSTGYTLALTLLKGANTPREYTLEALHDPEVKRFASLVSVAEDAQLTRDHKGHPCARVCITTQDGRRLDTFVLNAKGSPALPLTRDDIDRKFHSQVDADFGAERADELLRTLRNIDTLEDVAMLAPSLHIGSLAR